MDSNYEYMPYNQLFLPLATQAEQNAKTVSTRCDTCRENFISRRGLEIHMNKIHSNFPKVFICKQCSKSFKNKYLLRTHIKQVHSNAPRLSCSKCENTFSNKATLQKHMKRMHKPVVTLA
ncbi:hypothetical protein SteCoe_13408 [Stentor coeruleus]|uniref:C2H2-type domain-containing protein n=1 Tax=Stentor coeruleus TaxID=5963 RepID=A0A1R2C8H4_9CILI|nr:hypothetical protein SteCoe_13408 [Stentor coeruleus]